MAQIMTMRFSPLAAAALGLMAASAQAAAITWTGTTSTDFATGTNWVGNNPPANNDNSDVATFTENSPANKTPTITGGYNLGGLNFDNSTGWTLGGTGGTTLLRSVTSTGVGTNTITQKLKTYQGISTNTWTIGAGNILNVSSIYQDGGSKTLKITGGGTLVVAGAIDGWSSGSILHIDAGTVKIAASNIYLHSSTTGPAWIDSTSSYLQLLTTVSAAQAKITSGNIQDGTGLGLSVTDIGGGYVQIAAVPEPASLSLLATSALLMLRRRRRA